MRSPILALILLALCLGTAFPRSALASAACPADQRCPPQVYPIFFACRAPLYHPLRLLDSLQDSVFSELRPAFAPAARLDALATLRPRGAAALCLLPRLLE